MKNIFYIFLLFTTLSCKKEASKNFDENISVRITKVEQTISPNTFPFKNFVFDHVSYVYDGNTIQSILIEEENADKMSIDITLEKNNYILSFPNHIRLSDPLTNTIALKSLKIVPFENSLRWISNEYAVINPITSETSIKNRTLTYEYNESRIFSQLKSVFNGGDGAYLWDGEGQSLKIKEMNGDLVSKYSISNRQAMFSKDIKSGEDLEVSLTYEYVPEIPDGLVNIVNQAIMGIYNLGFEDYYFTWPYHLNKDNHINLAQNFSIGNGTHPYIFADWILGFGFPQFKFFPTSQNRLISSKHLKGKVFSGLDAVDSSLVYNKIDSIVSYPYQFDSIQQYIEISGLKIYYKIIK
ncbi:MAG: hypothetical protein LC105_05685 [Chitinophagales bacterium]|nr:hypothetical protein [Chitinophagales bacterium]